MKRGKICLTLTVLLCLCAAPAGAAARYELTPEELMLSKYAADQSVQYLAEGLQMTERRFCTHGDWRGWDVHYTGTLQKIVQPAEGLEAVVESRPLDFWLCQSQVFSGLDFKRLTDTRKVLYGCGRETSQTYLREMGDPLAASFIEFAVDEARAKERLADRAPADEAHQFVVLDMQVKNIFAGEEAIPVGNGDFTLVWDGGEAAASSSFMAGMYPDEQMLAQGESLTGTLVFEVPREVQRFKLVYRERWDDGLWGNTYAVFCYV